ncbi:TPA: SIS domain-containing protein [bacterium]|nr:SIS domain-containing protein [bacterium]
MEEQCKSSADVKKKIYMYCSQDILSSVNIILNAIRHGNKLLICGNGGSAADAQHIATELVIRMNKVQRPPISAIALTTDTSMLTAGGNDIGFDNVFSRQVEALGKNGDVLIAISTSGMSENVIRAVKEANRKGLYVIGFLGKNGGKLKKIVDIPIIIPADDTQRIQEGHITIGHIICGILEKELFN